MVSQKSTVRQVYNGGRKYRWRKHACAGKPFPTLPDYKEKLAEAIAKEEREPVIEVKAKPAPKPRGGHRPVGIRSGYSPEVWALINQPDA